MQDKGVGFPLNRQFKNNGERSVSDNYNRDDKNNSPELGNIVAER